MNSFTEITEISTPYRDDVPLLKKLGLNLFKCNHAEKTFIGTHENKSYKVDIWVTCLPAQFWNFYIKSYIDDYEYEISTGSGSFTEHWPIVELLGNCRVRIDEIKIDGEQKYKI